MTSPAPPGPVLGDTLNQRQKMVLLFSLMTALFIGALDQTIVATATPTILSELGGFHLLSWLFTGYLLSSTVIVPLVGKLSDTFGRKPFLLTGIIVFMVGSALCGASPNMESLIAFRVLQGLGGGMIFASVFATVGDLFPPAERGKYIGMFTGTFSLASILGPTTGGFITDTIGWRWVFYINIPIGLIALPAVWFNLPWSRGVTRPRIDFLGAALLTVASVSLLLGLVWAGDEYSWGSPQVLGSFAVAAVFLALFLGQEVRHPEPIVPLHLFRNRIFLVSNLVVFTLGAGLFGAITYLPIFVQTALGVSATASGVITTPQSLGVLFASVISGQVIARTGKYKYQSILGAVLFTASMVWLATVHLGTQTWHVSLNMVVLGLGFGLILPTMSLVVQNAVSHQYLGVASSSSQFFRQIGGVIGTAVFGAILASSFSSSFSRELPPDVAAQVPPAVLEKFSDPTLALNEREYALVREQVLSLPDGEALLAATLGAQQESIVFAVRRIFLGATFAAALCLVLTVFLKEVPLRRTFGPGPAQGDARSGDSAPPSPLPPEAPEPAPAPGSGGA